MPTRIEAPGFYDLPAAEYHADPCKRPSVSSGIISTIVDRTLADAKWKHPRLNPELEEEDRTQFDLGSVAHELLLGRGSGIVVIDADDWRTKAAKEGREAAIAAGRQPCLTKVYEQAEAMAAAARQQLADDADNADAFTNGVPEQVAIWMEETSAGAIYCRSMMDWRMNARPAIYDYKTFAPGPDPDGFVKYLFREARDVQDPFYSRGLAKLIECDWRDVEFRYVVQDPKPPYTLAVIQLDEQAREFAHERTMWAIERWASAGRAGRFEGYRPRTHYVAPPSYEMVAWAAKRQADEFADALDQRAA
ncbi:PD-(D/E)XK nuclease-like domain-containing protein [Sphingomonas baiyangensis]|uniref:Uncharacterized protein n=1 Tax=Sphingomonas baiyangensis TaxID=2572576 RepID=A0A4U1L1U1_9SPHN|nr:PD-(D/E)XK nuclease-like domain-containing protein [Sphingomonas baiyangensis]TKD50552.1 hypothetical protein FBR43_07085 [Sphingomonas baiyangensis]